MGVEYIEGGFKLKFGRRRTQITTYENMPIQTTSPIKRISQRKLNETYQATMLILITIIG